MIVNMKVR